MPISAAGSKPDRALEAEQPGRAPAARQAGFTLVELMVVVAVLGLTAGVVVWTLPNPDARVRDEALRLAARTRAAHDAAIVDARPVSLWATTAGYGFDRRVGAAWQPLAEKPFRVERWREGTRAELGDRSGRIRVTFDTTGMPDRAADIRVDHGEASATVRIGADGSVAVDAG